MKGIYVLIAGLFLVGWAFSAFADGTPTTTQSSTIHIETTYNAYGVALSSTQKTTTVTTTTRDMTVGGKTKTVTSTNTNVQITTSSWRGGSLKVDSLTGTSDTSGSDGSSSHTEYWTNYEYNDNGQLKSASGGAKTTGNRGKDDNGKELGTFSSTSTDVYEIRNGVALKISSTTTGENFGVDGQKSGSFTETTTSTYEVKGGSWQLMQEVTQSSSNQVDGSTENTTTTRTYTRDDNGVCTGISQTKTGYQEVVGSTGGKVRFNIENYVATFQFDPQQGWFLAKESYDWKSQPPENNQGSGSQDAAQGGGSGDRKPNYVSGTFNWQRFNQDTAGLSEEAKNQVLNDNLRAGSGGNIVILQGSNYWQP